MFNIQFKWSDLLNPKVLLSISVVVLLFVVYMAGKSSGASAKETEFDTYKTNSEKVVKWSISQRKRIDSLEIDRKNIQAKYDVLNKNDQILKNKLSTIQHKLDSLSNSLDNQLMHLPTTVDSATALTCKPWIDVLNTCKEVRTQLETKVSNLNDQVTNKDKEIDNKQSEVTNLVQQKTIAITRGDSLQNQLKLLPDPETCKLFIWFGPKCPSRASIGVAGGVIGFIGGIVITTYIKK